MDYISSLILSFSLTAISGIFIIPWLRRLKLGQKILEIGPRWHMSKQGTPTMGGIMFILGIAAAALLFGRDCRYPSYIYVLALGVACGLIGFLDDLTKITKKRNLGLTAIQKLVLQFAVAALFLSLLRWNGRLESVIWLPFFDVTFELNWIVYMIIASVFIVGIINAVNLTDGVDGLAAGVTLPVALFFTAVAYALGSEFLGLGMLSVALAGGMLGFLVYNKNPARVFMGDTGSLFLGGMIAGLGFAFNMPVILILLGFIYLAEMFSVILQVGYFKLTGGKRLFRMAPLHHHFEMGGWKEKKIVAVFAGITAVVCIAAYFGIRNSLGV